MSGAALSGKRVKRKEIKEIVDALLSLGFKDIVKDYEICGSYRREKEDSGDVDIVFVPKSIDIYNSWFNSLEIKKRKGKLADNVLIRDVQVDLFMATENSYAAMVMTWTGSRGFNIVMRGNLNKQGYVYTRNGIYDQKTGRIIENIKTEADIFDVAKINFVKPCDR
jgi:DNA polymerase/3'-5' exonuclease PolX